MRCTSSNVAIVVSPGVVIASAPCAQPQFTAQSAPFVEEAVDQPRGEGVAAAHAVENLQVGHRPRLVERALVVADRAPVVELAVLA